MGACQSSDASGQSVSSNATNDSNLSSVKNTIRNHSSESNITGVMTQDVIINNTASGPQPLMDLKCQRYNFLGLKQGGPVRMYGAAYTVVQKTDVKVVQINKEISDQSENIYNEVSGKIQSNLTANLGSPAGQAVARDAVNDARDETVAKIESYLTDVANKDLTQGQRIEINSTIPFRFQGECGEFKNPEINQTIMVDVHAEHIVNMITSDIQKKLSIQENTGKLDYDSTGGDTACQEEIGMGVLCCLAFLLCIYTIYYFTKETTDTVTAVAKDVSKAGIGIAENVSNAGIKKFEGMDVEGLTKLAGKGNATALLEKLGNSGMNASDMKGLGDMDANQMKQLLMSMKKK